MESPTPPGPIARRIEAVRNLPQGPSLGAQQIRQHGRLLVRRMLAGIALYSGLPLLGNGRGHVLRYRRRQVVEQLNAWLDGFKTLLVRFETCLHTWLAFHWLAFAVLLLRRISCTLTS